MNWFHISMGLLNAAFLIWGTAHVLRIGRAMSVVPVQSRKLVIVDSNVHPIVGKPTRAQWRLRRRAIETAAVVCEEYAETICRDLEEGSFSLAASAHAAAFHARQCAGKIRDLNDKYDREAPEFAVVNRQMAAADKVA